VGTASLDPTLNDYYNFVTVVDFEKLGAPDRQAVHTGQGDPARGDSHNASDPDEAHRLPHRHDAARVHLWVGGAPEEGPGEAYHEGFRADRRVLMPSDVL
ncbi:MAG: hypothetical protein R3185_05670, partial [Candidatus Thermoplasmatota archaeon]|nr:hypothetical protein [Candidatus Thermoplasmatota archaeon]